MEEKRIRAKQKKIKKSENAHIEYIYTPGVYLLLQWECVSKHEYAALLIHFECAANNLYMYDPVPSLGSVVVDLRSNKCVK